MGYTKEPFQEYVIIDDGVRLEAQLIGCGEQDSPFDDKNNPGNKEKRINFIFRITEEGSYQDQRLYGQVPLYFDRVSGEYKAGRKFFAWAAALLDVEELPDGVRIELEDLLDTTCIVEVGVRTRKVDGEDVAKNFAKAVYSLSEATAASTTF